MTMMQNMAASIRLLMDTVAPGDKIRIVCPFCSADHEKSFEVRRMTEKTHLLSFRCYRGTCDEHGYVVDREGASMVLQQSTAVDNAYNKPLTQHGHCSESFLHSKALKFGIDVSYLEAQGVRHSKGDALCMPWRDQTGAQIGWVEKRFNPAWHKSHHDLCNRTHGRIAFPSIPRSYLSLPDTATGILVEGLLDAYRVNCYAYLTGANVYAVALLGASISKSDALTLSSLFNKLMVCLDPNMWPRGAISLMNSFKGMPVHMRATTMPHDPKDAKDVDLEELFDRCREMHACLKI